MTDVVAIVSGGMDSATLVAHYLTADKALQLLSFDYGQRHRKELAYASQLAEHHGLPWQVVDLRGLTPLLATSALTNDAIPVPDGHYAEDSMKATVVPNRNAIMLAIAAGVASSQGANVVAIGVHAGDHFIYPDCRPAFIEAMSVAMQHGTAGFGDVRVEAPFLRYSKATIARLGATFGVDFAGTWSCYKGGKVHCGTCGTCTERAEAFDLARVPDPTVYATAPVIPATAPVVPSQAS